jgi:hypothetical protein
MSTAPDTADPAKPPVAAPAATGVTLAVALALIGLGVVAVRDVLLWAGLITGAPWILNVLNYFDGLTPQTWMLPAGIAAALIGALMVASALRPRRRTHQPLRAPGAWITTRDLIRLGRAAAQGITGVATTTAGGSARTVTVVVTPLAGYDVETVKQAAHVAVTDALAPMARPPRVRIRIKEWSPA